MGLKNYFPSTIIFLTVISANFGICEENLFSKISPPALAQLESKLLPVGLMVECKTTPGNTRAIDEKLKAISELMASSVTRDRRACDILTDLVHDAQSIVLKALQDPIDMLTQMGIKFEVYWRVNMIFIRKVSFPQVLKLAKSDTVRHMRLPRSIPAPSMPVALPGPRPMPEEKTAWNIDMIDARCASITCLGDGVVVGVIDTGAMWNHTELKDTWRGPGKYSWMDGVYPPTTPYPVDKNGHGTFTTGLVVGKTVGVAPAASWIVCAAYSEEKGDLEEHGLLKCMEFMACPYLWNDTSIDKSTKNCSMRPHVINDSWRGDFVNIRPSTDPFFTMLEYWNSPGIISTFAGGNIGPSCASAVTPGSYSNALAVGAVDRTATIAYFSSRGPYVMTEHFVRNSTDVGTCTWSASVVSSSSFDMQHSRKPICKVIKPDIVAPGVKVRSSINFDSTSYQLRSGTSSAAPMVAGVIALMMCARPDLQWNYTLAYDLITQNADTSRIDLAADDKSKYNLYAKPSNILCNFVFSGMCQQYPNNVYGWGLVWACKAVKAVKMMSRQNPSHQ